VLLSCKSGKQKTRNMAFIYSWTSEEQKKPCSPMYRWCIHHSCMEPWTHPEEHLSIGEIPVLTVVRRSQGWLGIVIKFETPHRKKFSTFGLFPGRLPLNKAYSPPLPVLFLPSGPTPQWPCSQWPLETIELFSSASTRARESVSPSSFSRRGAKVMLDRLIICARPPLLLLLRRKALSVRAHG
jgi:hypothetical protein